MPWNALQLLLLVLHCQLTLGMHCLGERLPLYDPEPNLACIQTIKHPPEDGHATSHTHSHVTPIRMTNIALHTAQGLHSCSFYQPLALHQHQISKRTPHPLSAWALINRRDPDSYLCSCMQATCLHNVQVKHAPNIHHNG